MVKAKSQSLAPVQPVETGRDVPAREGDAERFSLRRAGGSKRAAWRALSLRCDTCSGDIFRAWFLPSGLQLVRAGGQGSVAIGRACRAGPGTQWLSPCRCRRQHLAKGRGDGAGSRHVVRKKSALLYYVSALRPIPVLLI